MLTSGSCSISHHHRLSSLVLKPASSTPHHHHMARPGSCSLGSCVRAQSSRGEVPMISRCVSEREDTQDHRPLEGSFSSISVAGGVVALGKFDALHVGHRELVTQASRVGTPFLMSFVGMAEVLGWEPRIPIVAKCDRQRVLSSWAPYCGNVIPLEFKIEFSSVRSLSPQQFVEKLAQELHVRGVVTGENYRFGFRAAGDSSLLVRLCEGYGISAHIIPSVMDKNQNFIHSDASNSKERGQVSSTRVRHALAAGDMNYVTELLGRRHRLILSWSKESESCRVSKHSISVPRSCLLNLAPADGLYRNCFVVTGHEELIPCEVEIGLLCLCVRG
ncbi:hypothetical protein MLD38_038022 [Melastoma candidum]|uniref:Uncharacterized protein n=1 Tax=Melastoma candidum TaxID=119954 RepID=A0ACB9KZY0_9MYRT|nr:hypothetical protein MLD38_038022 [Melastoma candidum]